MGVNPHQGSPRVLIHTREAHRTARLQRQSPLCPKLLSTAKAKGSSAAPRNHWVTAKVLWNQGLESSGGSVVDHGGEHHSFLIASDSCRSPSCTKALMSWVQVMKAQSALLRQTRPGTLTSHSSTLTSASGSGATSFLGGEDTAWVLSRQSFLGWFVTGLEKTEMVTLSSSASLPFTEHSWKCSFSGISTTDLKYVSRLYICCYKMTASSLTKADWTAGGDF